ncbi:MAG: chemotaxis protein CheC [Myxococcaceae bacterium]
MNLNGPSELQLDALREVANVGVGHAANALSALVGGSVVQIDVPKVRLLAVSDLPEAIGGADAQVVAASLEMTGGLSGRILLVLPELDANRLCSLLLKREVSGELQSDAQSALNEVANIVASACLSAIGRLTSLKLLPSVPTLMQDSGGVVCDTLVDGAFGQQLMLLEARFMTRHSPAITGQLLVLPEAASLKELLQRLGV